MRDDRIQYITQYIEGYTGYIDSEDIDRINIFIRDRLTRLYKVLTNFSTAAPPDISSYFMMISKLSSDIISILSIEYKVSEIESDVTEKLIELDYKAVELLNVMDKTIDSILSAPPLPMYREYSSMLYKLVARLKEFLKRRLEILGLKV